MKIYWIQMMMFFNKLRRWFSSGCLIFVDIMRMWYPERFQFVIIHTGPGFHSVNDESTLTSLLPANYCNACIKRHSWDPSSKKIKYDDYQWVSGSRFDCTNTVLLPILVLNIHRRSWLWRNEWHARWPRASATLSAINLPASSLRQMTTVHWSFPMI